MLLIFIILPVFHYIGQACIPMEQIENEILFAEEIIADELTTTTTSTTTTPIIYGCPDSTWTVITRASYYWCAYIIVKTTNLYMFAEECAKINANAVVWGIQDQGELKEILTLARSFQVISSARLVLGALRRPECYSVVGVSATCTALNSYYWTDGYTTGTDGFNWEFGYPANPYGASDPWTYLYVNISTERMFDYRSDYSVEAGLCGMLPIQLN